MRVFIRVSEDVQTRTQSTALCCARVRCLCFGQNLNAEYGYSTVRSTNKMIGDRGMKEDRVTFENRDSTVDRLLMVIERFGVHVSRLASFIILDFFLATK